MRKFLSVFLRTCASRTGLRAISSARTDVAPHSSTPSSRRSLATGSRSTGIDILVKPSLQMMLREMYISIVIRQQLKYGLTVEKHSLPKRIHGNTSTGNWARSGEERHCVADPQALHTDSPVSEPGGGDFGSMYPLCHYSRLYCRPAYGREIFIYLFIFVI